MASAKPGIDIGNRAPRHRLFFGTAFFRALKPLAIRVGHGSKNGPRNFYAHLTFFIHMNVSQ